MEVKNKVVPDNGDISLLDVDKSSQIMYDSTSKSD